MVYSPASGKMARTKFKCHFFIYICFLLSVTVRSLPIRTSTLETTDSAYQNVLHETTLKTVHKLTKETEPIQKAVNRTLNLENRSLLRQNIRPGQSVRSYDIQIRRNGLNFEGTATIEVQLTSETRTNPMIFNMQGLEAKSVRIGILSGDNTAETNFRLIGNQLEVSHPAGQTAGSYTIIVEYTGTLTTNGLGLFLGTYDETDYVAMNLYPTNARRVFPCMDEPNLSSITSFTFEGFEYNSVLFNTALRTENQAAFQPVEGPSHLWGMIAHNLENINQPTTDVRLYVRPGVVNQDAQASVTINNFYNALNDWTQRSYNEIMTNQNGNMHVIALPDVSRDWYALSTVCVWEPYMLMETTGSVMQRKLVITNIAEAMTKQWFGFLIRPENWRYQWLISGLSSYAAYDIAKNFQTDSQGLDESLLDMDTIFTTDVIQESLLLDSYTSSPLIQSVANIFVENAIRLHLRGLIKYKAPALLRMLKTIISNDETDLVQGAARTLLETRGLEAINPQIFYDAINSMSGGNNLIGSVEVFMVAWVTNTGYPVINVESRPDGVLITQERFSFSTIPHINFPIPITYTTSIESNFDIRPPIMMRQTTTTLNFDLGDWLVMNIQGQGYYRVNYDGELWSRITMALADPLSREQIHPLNRASIIDDSLNLARAGKINYNTAFSIALTMEHESNYGVWRAFIRNMEFFRKRLMPFVNNEGLEEGIYLRLIRKTLTKVEAELGFQPDNARTEPAMQTLTRALVMEHACRAGYDPCIAAAVDLFFDPTDPQAVNPNIPRDIRPAVYCTMVRIGDENIRTALLARMELEPSRYERLIILQSLACSQDEAFINEYLGQTVAADSPYVLEERLKIFEAVASADVNNARRALNFMTTRTNDIRNMYGGPDRLEEAIFSLVENMVTEDLASDFNIWVNSLGSISNLGDSNVAAIRARSMITENLDWNSRMREAYDWIDANHAPTVFVSTLLITLCSLITLIIY